MNETTKEPMIFFMKNVSDEQKHKKSKEQHQQPAAVEMWNEMK